VVVEDHIEVIAAEELHEPDDRPPVVGRPLAEPAHAEPAALVERYADGVDPPGAHGGDRALIVGAVEHVAEAPRAHVLGARAVDAEQSYHPAVIDEVAPAHV